MGFSALTNWTHNDLGLLFGIHVMHGINVAVQNEELVAESRTVRS